MEELTDEIIAGIDPNWRTCPVEGCTNIVKFRGISKKFGGYGGAMRCEDHKDELV